MIEALQQQIEGYENYYHTGMRFSGGRIMAHTHFTRIKAMLPFLLFMGLDFYLLPVLIDSTGMGMVALLVIIPLLCLICSIVYGAKHSFHILYVVFVPLLFLLTILIYYNASAWIYAVGYVIIALIGNSVGMIFYKHKS
jgi:hypothetical protein